MVWRSGIENSVRSDIQSDIYIMSESKSSRSERPSSASCTYKQNLNQQQHKHTINSKTWGENTQTLHIVREPGGPTEHPPPTPPGTFHYGPKMYLRVSRTQSHLFPGQPLGCTGVTALCARVPSCVRPGADWAQVTNASFKSLVYYCFVT